MAIDLKLVNQKVLSDTLADWVTIPTTSATTNVANYIKIGENEYKIAGGENTISFTLQTDAGGIVKDYDLTEEQVNMFKNSGEKKLVLKMTSGGGTTVFLLNSVYRTEGGVVYVGSPSQMGVEFTVVFETAHAEYVQSGMYATMSECEQYVQEYVVGSESAEPTKTAKSIKIGNEYWGVSGGSSIQVIDNLTSTSATDALSANQGRVLNESKLNLTGGTLTGDLVMGGESNIAMTNGYIYGGGSSTNGESALSLYSDSGTHGGFMSLNSSFLMLGTSNGSISITNVPDTSTATIKLVRDGSGPSSILCEKDIVNLLTSTDATKVLSAAQGKVLNDAIAGKMDVPSQMGADNVPIYVNVDGAFAPGSVYAGGTSVTLNGESKSGQAVTLVAPVDAGTAGQYLASTAGVPTWKDIINALDQDITDQPLSAAQGKALNGRIDAIGTLGRFLSIWNCTTGLPLDNPPGSTTGTVYNYKTGDYYVVGTVGTTNYKPDGSSYTVGTASTTPETGTVKGGDLYRYSGSGWTLQSVQSQEVSFRTLTGAVADNSALVAEFAKYAPLAGATFTGSIRLDSDAAMLVGADALTITTSNPNTGIINIYAGGKTLKLSGGDATFDSKHILNSGDIVANLDSTEDTKVLAASQATAILNKVPEIATITANTETTVTLKMMGFIGTFNGNLLSVQIANHQSSEGFIVNGTAITSGESFTLTTTGSIGGHPIGTTTTITLTRVEGSTVKILSTSSGVIFK